MSNSFPALFLWVSLSGMLAVLSGCEAKQEESVQRQIAADLIETAARMEDENQAKAIANSEVNPTPELPLPEKVENKKDARQLMLAIQSRVKDKPEVEVKVGDLTARLEYHVQEEYLWINAFLRFPKGTPTDNIIRLLPEAAEATQLKAFSGMSEYVRQASTDKGWYLGNGAGHDIPPVTHQFFQVSGSLASFDADDPRGPILILGTQVLVSE
jgi:hypothetical protein